MSKTIVLRPRISEKAYGLSQHSTYVFDVPTSVNRVQVAAAVQAQFEVTVETVRIAKLKGKAKMSYRKRSRPVKGSRSDIKRAYVSLKEGDKLPIFASEEEEQAKAEKKAAKTAAKEKK